jgi:hypothetical protein
MQNPNTTPVQEALSRSFKECPLLDAWALYLAMYVFRHTICNLDAITYGPASQKVTR